MPRCVDPPQTVDVVDNSAAPDYLLRDCTMSPRGSVQALEVDEHELFDVLLAHVV